MPSAVASAARKFRRLTKGGVASGAAFDRVVEEVGAVAHWNEWDRRASGTVVTYPLDYPIESSVGLLFPDDSGLVFGDGKAWIARIAMPKTDTTVYRYIEDLIPIVPIGRSGRVPYGTRYPFTDTEQTLVIQATQIMDIVLMGEHGLQLSPWMRWFHQDRLLVKNLISAGGDAFAVCCLMLGMLSKGRLTVVEETSADDGGSTLTIRHQSVP